MREIGRLSVVLICVFFSAAVFAQAAAAPDLPEPGSVEEIAKATTAPQFLSPWVSYLPASTAVPSPRAFLHRIPGAPGEFVNSATAYAYARALAAASPRVEVFTIGKSEEGRDIVLLAIALLLLLAIAALATALLAIWRLVLARLPGAGIVGTLLLVRTVVAGLFALILILALVLILCAHRDTSIA